jgi:hypothetical protein
VWHFRNISRIRLCLSLAFSKRPYSGASFVILAASYTKVNGMIYSENEDR